MTQLDDAAIDLVAKLCAEGLTKQAIQRVTGFDLRTIRKYCDVYDVTLPHCTCKPGICFIGCLCETAQKEEAE